MVNDYQDKLDSANRKLAVVTKAIPNKDILYACALLIRYTDFSFENSLQHLIENNVEKTVAKRYMSFFCSSEKYACFRTNRDELKQRLEEVEKKQKSPGFR
jgi:hypothetical protein